MHAGVEGVEVNVLTKVVEVWHCVGRTSAQGLADVLNMSHLEAQVMDGLRQAGKPGMGVGVVGGGGRACVSVCGGGQGGGAPSSQMCVQVYGGVGEGEVPPSARCVCVHVCICLCLCVCAPHGGRVRVEECSPTFSQGDGLLR